MMQFVSGHILNTSAPVIALPVTAGKHGEVAQTLDPRWMKAFPDTWVRLKRHLLTHQLDCGDIWVDHTKNGTPLILLVTHQSNGQPSVTGLRRSLRRLARWADLHQVPQVHVASLTDGCSHNWINVCQQVAFEQLVDSRCDFQVQWSQEASDIACVAKRSPLARFTQTSPLRIEREHQPIAAQKLSV